MNTQAKRRRGRHPCPCTVGNDQVRVKVALQRPIRYSKQGPGVWTITWRDSAVPDAPEPDELWDEEANEAHLAYQQELAEELSFD
jgi:hypothetical protein